MRKLGIIAGVARMLSYVATGLLELSIVLLLARLVVGDFKFWEISFIASLLSPVFAIASIELEYYVIRKEKMYE